MDKGIGIAYSPYVRENLEFLKKLASTRSDKKKNLLLLNSTSDQILAIVEICANILKFNFPLTNRQRRRLARYAEYYRSLSRVRSEKGARRKLQVGGALPIAAILVPVLSALAEHFIEKALK